MSVPQNLIEELRNAFLKDVSEKGMESVHPKDYERVKSNDDWLRRFLLHNESDVATSLKMLWVSVTWRKDFKVNDINENTVKMDILAQGGFFPLEKDIDDSTILVFKCKKHTKGNPEIDEIKRCVVYWFERLEREGKGKPISIFFDMESCGLSNMDMDFTQYLIGLFKEYYPFFLNYIIIYEMPWVLSAAFKIIKTWLPEKAISRIKQVGKKDLTKCVPKEYALQCWGGDNDYVFRFIPEQNESDTNNVPESPSPPVNNKKVHFVDGSPMSETPSSGQGDREASDGGGLKVTPPDIITFVRHDSELISTMELQNIDTTHLSFKLKTTSPEKFRVKPSAGCLAPGATATITVTLLPGFQLGGLSKDKFLVMSTAIEEKEAQYIDLTELWKNTSGRKVNQHRLRCVQGSEGTRNGNAVPVSSVKSDDAAGQHDKQLTAIARQLTACEEEIRRLSGQFRYLLVAAIALAILCAVELGYTIRREYGGAGAEAPYCKYMENP